MLRCVIDNGGAFVCVFICAFFDVCLRKISTLCTSSLHLEVPLHSGLQWPMQLGINGINLDQQSQKNKFLWWFFCTKFTSLLNFGWGIGKIGKITEAPKPCLVLLHRSMGRCPGRKVEQKSSKLDFYNEKWVVFWRFCLCVSIQILGYPFFSEWQESHQSDNLFVSLCVSPDILKTDLGVLVKQTSVTWCAHVNHWNPLCCGWYLIQSGTGISIANCCKSTWNTMFVQLISIVFYHLQVFCCFLMFFE